jgi:NAD(P)-dependent dehydrogenase (short-subunit alcohol dehydrogenase family)
MSQPSQQETPISGWQRSLSVFVPVLNEVDNLEPTVGRLVEALTVSVEDFEILIVDDGSTDGTRAIADRLSAANPTIKVLHHARNMGLGYCYTRAYKEATKEYFVYIPGDNTWPYRSFLELFGNMGRADFITSFAINPEARPGARRFVSTLYTKLLNLLFGRHLNYYNGLTIYPVSFLRRDPATTFGFGFQAEVMLKALTLGLSYIEVGLPIDERAAGVSKAVNLRNILSVAYTVLRTFFQLRIAGRWRADDWSPDVSSPPGAMMAMEEVGFDQDELGTASAAVASPPDQVVVIVGASSGIGAALATDLATAGYRVFACSRSLERLQSAFAGNAKIRFAVCDVADERSVAEFVEFVRAETPRVDALINCAGGFGAIGPIDRVHSDEWLATIRDNLFGTFLSTKHFLPLLEQATAPRIINMSGGGAFSPFPNFSAYACAKAAVVRLTETLAVELAPRGISVNAVAPGIVPTRAHEATMAAGIELAGPVQYHRTNLLLRDAREPAYVARMHTVRRCVRALLSSPYRGLTGKTISANFDPWASQAFLKQLPGITRSELYTMRRTNLVNLPEGLLRTSLTKIWAKHGVRR